MGPDGPGGNHAGSRERHARGALRVPSGWTRHGARLVKTFVYDDFQSAALFVTRVAIAASAVDDPPDIGIHGNEVTLTIGSRAAGTPTSADIALARRTERKLGDHRHPIGLAGAGARRA
jgi:pterin-4a-carbinolamine dehydratase